MAPSTPTGYEPRPRSTPRALLRRLREIMAEDLSSQERLNGLVQAIAANMVADVCSIYVRRADDVLELFATEGLSAGAVHATRMSMEEGLVGWVARNRRPIKLREAQRHPDFSYREETGEDPYHAFLGVPIIRAGRVLGVLVMQNATTRTYSEEETEVAQTVATVLAEIVSSGDLLEDDDKADVEAILHQPERAVGTALVDGVVEGVVVRRDPRTGSHSPFAADVAAERQRLDEALGSVRKSVDDMMAADRALGSASQEILEVFRLFAYDKGWERKLDEKVLAGLSAESAVEQVQEENRARMRQVPDPYLRERLHDLDDLSRRLLRALAGEEDSLPELPENAVFLADTLGPADILELQTDRLKGLVVGEASATSHAAIVARSLGIPMVSGLTEFIDKADPGDTIVVDGGVGEVHLRPPVSVIESFRERARLRTQALARYAASRDEPAVTTDGIEIDLQMNAGLLFDMKHLEETGVSSVGLFRTELQFLLARSLPSATDQENFYRQVLEAAGGRCVIFRTADIGSDKRAPYMKGPLEGNPAMGWRGLRVAIDREAFMRTQIRALLAAAGERPLAIMLPLVTTAGELRQVRMVMEKEFERHEKHVGTLPPRIEIGAMIEIPAAAWDVEAIAAEADFLSVGGNDLAQFFFAADRETPSVSERYDPLSAPFLSFLERTAKGAKAVGKPLGYCGEQAADPLMALALIAIGVQRLSLAPAAIGPIKAMIRSASFATLRARVSGLLEDRTINMRNALSQFAIEEGLALG